MTSPVRYTYPHNPEMYYDEFTIPKKNGKTRRICAPSPALLTMQRAELSRLYELFNRNCIQAGITDVFHGFIPGKNCVTAAMKHIGFRTTIIMDISNFFDTVNGQRHLRPNQNMIGFLHEDGTLAQGFATSPILASFAIGGIIRKIKLAIQELDIQYTLTVYADDIQISVNTEDYDTLAGIQLIVQEEFNQKGFEIHPHKTRTMFAKHGYRRILGIAVGEDHLKPSRKVIRKIRAAMHQNNGPSLGGLVNYANLNLPKAMRQE